MAQNTLPDYHFLLIAPNLGSQWFYEAARRYWLRFFPTVISNYTLLPLIPEQYSMAVTVVARRDRISQFGVELARLVPRALFDPVVYDFYEDTKAELDRRAETYQPFGVPLPPTATWTPAPTAQPLLPTPGPIATDGPTPTPAPVTASPSPEITEEGTPEVTAEATDDLTPEVTEEPGTPAPPTPLYPTPGPVTGGRNP
ncbi:MAG: hypothetical protein K8L99_24065 [Anaerolineae bacterium]|nr:hypothetical protein [Anaerolineae bacterium]